MICGICNRQLTTIATGRGTYTGCPNCHRGDKILCTYCSDEMQRAEAKPVPFMPGAWQCKDCFDLGGGF